jgi:SSS family solute:Na+ symporter
MGWILAHSRGSALSLYYTVTAIVAGGLVGLFFLAFLCAKAGESAAIFGVVVSLVVMVWATLTGDHGSFVNLGRWNFPWHDYMIGAVGHVTLFVAGFAFSMIFPGPPLSDPGLTLWGWRKKQHAVSQAERPLLS